MFVRVREDIQTVFAHDPAARSVAEVIFCYPGLHALLMHRVAHRLWDRKWYFLARLLSHINRWLTGIEIHPGATIGRRFFIDHGMGVVIGETTEIGNDVLLYQGVVLGGTSLEKKKRHPTLGNHVLVGAGAKILGAVTVGDGARVGAGSVVIRDVPPGVTVVGVPGKISKGPSKRAIDFLEHGKLPDPISEALGFMLQELDDLERRMERIESEEGLSTKMEQYFQQRHQELLQDFAPSTLEFYDGEGI